MKVKPQPTLCLKDAVIAAGPHRDVEVTAYCTCGMFLGRYGAGPPVTLRKDGAIVPGEPGIVLSEPGIRPGMRMSTREEAVFTPGDGIRGDMRLYGPRTQPGLYPEQYGGRTYIRKRCPCRSTHPKRGLASIADLPITVSERGGVTLVFD